MNRQLVNSAFLAGLTKDPNYRRPVSQGRRKPWSPRKNESRSQRKRKSKNRRRKAYRLMIQAGGDYLRTRSQEKSFMAELFPQFDTGDI